MFHNKVSAQIKNTVNFESIAIMPCSVVMTDLKQNANLSQYEKTLCVPVYRMFLYDFPKSAELSGLHITTSALSHFHIFSAAAMEVLCTTRS